MKQYADDTTIYHAAISTSKLETELAKDVKGVAEWVEKNGPSLNTKKM